ncbi:GNAT family N-acetyltransferase [Caballeronia sp.]|uniref:GNAT family N-acetyltransferase n=1 Tax=Caballeronia sp. TaxID=1931223 RepID=UPI003C63B175
MNRFPELQTDRLLLREIVQEDASALFAIHSDADNLRWFGTDPFSDLSQTEKLIEVFAGWRQMPDPGTRWGIERRSDSALIGTCGLFKWNRNWKTCVVGYELARSAQGAGFMRETLLTAFSYGFNEMKVNRISADIHPLNEPSIRLLRALGFVEEGRARQAGYWGGEYHDLVQFGLLRQEYEQSLETIHVPT